MKLYLARHGEARENSVGERVLTSQGQQAIEHMGVYLAEHYPFSIQQGFHSGKKRAQQTAEIFIRHFMPQVDINSVLSVLPYLAPNDAIEPFLTQVALWQQDTLVVGHLPYLGILVSALLGPRYSGEYLFAPGEMVCLAKSNQEAFDWQLVWQHSPASL